MLFGKWSEVVARYGERVALWRVDCDERLTFEQLDACANDCLQDGEVWRADGDSPDFLPTLIAAWKHEKPVILMEAGHHNVRPIREEIPTGTVLIKQACGASGVERSLFFTGPQVLAEGMRNLEGLGLHVERPGLAAISLAHSYGFGCLTLPLLLGGVPIHLVSTPLPMFIENALQKNAKVFLPGVPAIWKMWWKTGVTAHPSIDLALSAGSQLSSDLEGAIFSESGLKIHNFYGTTETGAIAFDNTAVPRTEAGEIGSVLAGVDLAINDGFVTVRSDSRAESADALLCSEEFESDFYRTTDLGRIDHGKLILTGSRGGAINVAGRKVSPGKLERILMEHPGVISVQITKISSSDIDRFEEIHAKVTVARGIGKRELREGLGGRFENWEMPRHWEIILPSPFR